MINSPRISRHSSICSWPYPRRPEVNTLIPCKLNRTNGIRYIPFQNTENFCVICFCWISRLVRCRTRNAVVLAVIATCSFGSSSDSHRHTEVRRYCSETVSFFVSPHQSSWGDGNDCHREGKKYCCGTNSVLCNRPNKEKCKSNKEKSRLHESC